MCCKLCATPYIGNIEAIIDGTVGAVFLGAID